MLFIFLLFRGIFIIWWIFNASIFMKSSIFAHFPFIRDNDPLFQDENKSQILFHFGRLLWSIWITSLYSLFIVVFSPSFYRTKKEHSKQIKFGPIFWGRNWAETDKWLWRSLMAFDGNINITIQRKLRMEWKVFTENWRTCMKFLHKSSAVFKKKVHVKRS